MEFHWIPLGFPVTINRYKEYPNLATKVASGSEGIKK